MSEDRFKPPAARVEDPGRGKGSTVKGVIAGLVVDLATTMLSGIVVSIGWGIALGVAGHSQQEIEATLSRADADPLLSTLFLGVGVLCSVLGGYVCERIARRGDYKAGSMLAVLSAVLGLAMGASSTSVPMLALLVFLTVGSVLLGTRLAFPQAAAERSAG
jgi:MFS family permease